MNLLHENDVGQSALDEAMTMTVEQLVKPSTDIASARRLGKLICGRLRARNRVRKRSESRFTAANLQS